MKIKPVDEFEFIDRVKNKLPELKHAILGIGDDCAILSYTKDKFLLLTMDMLIENVHFDLSMVSGDKVGRKALAVSLSDLAAMAGIPRYCLVSLGIPRNMSIDILDGFYSGLLELAEEFDVELIGGDTNASEKFMCDICVVGEVEKRFLVRRDGAKIGDNIFVTGSLGGSIKGKQYNFVPRVREARILVKNFKINSMIDISDGLSLDLHHITDASNVGAVICDRYIPISCDADSRTDALTSGEDFELLFTTPADVTEDVLRRKLSILVSKIGKIVRRRDGVKIVKDDGRKVMLNRVGYKHF
jgi:thiamine-monophosphate kinase